MRILQPEDFARQPWKNGGGVTHEIAKVEDGDGLLWRLSLAEVATDGAFSAFPGLTRCLTVIEGDGIALHGPQSVLAAPLLTPVTFSGDLPVTGRLANGPIRDLNLIHDATRIDGTVSLLSGPETARHVAPEGGQIALFCVSGDTSANGRYIAPFAIAFAPCLDVTLTSGARALLIRLTPKLR